MARAVGGAERPSGRPRASIVIVSHQSRADLERCLPTMTDDCEVIVVDNASTDGGQELVEQRFPGVRLHALESNGGYGVAANVGIDASDAEYVLLMNADAWPLGDAIGRLVDFADRHPEVGIVGPGLLWPDGSPQRSVFGYPRAGLSLAAWAAFPSSVSRAYAASQRLVGRARRGRTAAAAGGPRVLEVTEPRFVSGAVMLLRRSALDDVGRFDESFFMYSEETDLCHRMRRGGWRVAVFRGAAFVHTGGSSTDSHPERMYQEQLLSYLRFFAKHHGQQRADRARRLLAVALFLRAGLARGDARRQGRLVARRFASSRAADLLEASKPIA